MLEIEVPFLIRPSLCTFPDQFAKSATGHSIQKEWFEEFPWLQLAENMTSIYCGSCHWAYKNRRLNASDMSILKNTKLPWINKDEGFQTFKKDKESIKKHNESRIHRNAESALRSAWKLAEHRVTVDNTIKEESLVNRTALRAIFENVRLCGQQGMALRGHRDEEYTANFNCLMNLIGKFDSKVSKYLSSSAKFKFCSKDIQNEVLKCISHSLLRDLIERIRKESIGKAKVPLFSIIIDETTDINRTEQVSFCLRFCNVHMESEEVFSGFHSTTRTDSGTLLSLVKTSLMSFDLPIAGIRGQGYDGAANMAGRENGLQAKILKENSKAIYLYCFGHQLNLVVQESLNGITDASLALERMNGVVEFIKNSPKKWARFNAILTQTGQRENHNHNLIEQQEVRALY